MAFMFWLSSARGVLNLAFLSGCSLISPGEQDSLAKQLCVRGVGADLKVIT